MAAYSHAFSAAEIDAGEILKQEHEILILGFSGGAIATIKIKRNLIDSSNTVVNNQFKNKICKLAVIYLEDEPHLIVL